MSQERTEIRVAGLTVHDYDGFQDGPRWDGGTKDSAYDLSRVLPQLKDGPQAARVLIDLNCIAFGDSFDDASRNIRHRIEVEAAWTLLPADQPTVRVLSPTDPDLAMRVRNAMSTWRPTQAPWGSDRTLFLNANAPPVGLGFTVFLRAAEGGEVTIASFACAAGKKQSDRLYVPWGGSMYTGPPPPPYRHVVLRPDVEPATETLDITVIWGGDVILEDVYPAGAPDGREP